MQKQHKLLFSISNNIGVYEEPVLQIKKIPHHAVKFETGEEKRIVYESLYWNFKQICGQKWPNLTELKLNIEMSEIFKQVHCNFQHRKEIL